jgi:iron complex outermembrane receptor protein
VAADGGAPIQGAVVTVVGTTLRGVTDTEGRFALGPAPEGAVAVRASRIGYAPREAWVEPPGTSIEIALMAAAVPIEPILVTATRHEQLAADAPVSIAVATAEDIARRSTIAVDDVVERVPGVQIFDGQINVRGSTGFAKGVGSRVLLLVDGAPAMQGDRGGINWDLLPVTEIERVEVLKGTGSALYGSGALGGVVNLITREIPDRPTLRVRILGGAYANPRPVWRWRDDRALFGGVDVTATHALGPIRAMLAAGAFGNAGYRENNDDARYRWFGKVAYLPGPALRADLSVAAAREDYGSVTFWCAQGQCEDRGLAYQPFRVDSMTLGDRTTSDKYFAQATLRRVVSPRLALRARASWYRTEFWDDFGTGDDSARADRYGAEIGGEWHAAPDRTVSVGTEAAYGTVQSSLFGDHSQTELAWYAESETPLGGTVRTTLGMRVDAIAVDGKGLTAVASPRLGVMTRRGPASIRASLGRAFRAPSLAERFVSVSLGGIRVIPNPNLAHETSWSGEVGASAAVAPGALLDAALFWGEYDDLIEPALVTAGTEIQFTNLTRARIRGLDLSLAAAPTSRLSATAAYTYLDARDLGRDLVLPFRPRHLATLAADLSARSLTLGAEIRLSSRPERVDIFEADTRVAARTVDLRAGWRRGGYRVLLKVENVFNYTYTLVPRTLEPPRTVSLAVMLGEN